MRQRQVFCAGDRGFKRREANRGDELSGEWEVADDEWGMAHLGFGNGRTGDLSCVLTQAANAPDKIIQRLTRLPGVQW